MYSTISINSLHTRFQDWNRELIFYKEEIRILERRLNQCTLYTENSTDLSRLMQLGKKITNQRAIIDSLKSVIDAEEKHMGGFIQDISGMQTDSFHVDSHEEMELSIQSVRQAQRELKSALFNYLVVH